MTSTIARVLHLSDLHFGTKGQTEVWRSLVRFVRNDLQPDAVLLTGDIVDTPKERLFEQAALELQKLCEPYRSGGECVQLLLCPGNHDRFYRGNRFGIPWPFGERFEHYFRRYYPDGQNVIKLNGQISLEVTCIDTTENVRFFARGAVLKTTLDKLAASGATKPAGHERSLRVLLMHHHLLPIPDLESDGEAGLLKPFLGATTIVDNPGRVLQALCSGRFDLVMHGHEHAFNLARFDSMGSGSLPITVLSAPSSTGVHTAGNCELDSAHLNVLELQADETLWLNRLEYDAPRGSWASTSRRLLMSDVDMRKAWFSRSPSAVRPDSGGRILFEHTKDFDIVVRKTDCDVEVPKGQKFKVEVQSTSEGACDLRCRYLKEGKLTEIIHVPFFSDDERKNVYSAEIPVLLEPGVVVDRLMTQYVLKGASEATTSRLRRRPEAAREYFASRRMESVFSGTRGRRIAWYEISLLLPLAWAPCGGLGGVSAYVQRKGETEPVLSQGLTAKIVPSGDGHYSLRIAYPDVHTKYYLAWQAFADDVKSEAHIEEAEALDGG